MKKPIDHLIEKKQVKRNVQAKISEELMKEVDKYLEKHECTLVDFIKASFQLALGLTK